MKAVIRTEIWNTKNGPVAKAVVRNERGVFLGATNQTEALPAKKIVRPRVTLVGAK